MGSCSIGATAFPDGQRLWGDKHTKQRLPVYFSPEEAEWAATMVTSQVSWQWPQEPALPRQGLHSHEKAWDSSWHHRPYLCMSWPHAYFL